MTNNGFIKVACSSPKVRVGDTVYNTAQIMQIMTEAKDQKTSVLLFPELSITGYTCGDLFFQRQLQDSALIGLSNIIEHSLYMDMLVAVGLPLWVNNSLFNVMALVLNGEILGIVPKTYLPTYNEFYEQRWFSSATLLLDEDVFIFNDYVPIGNNIIFTHKSIPEFKLGIEICEDLWTPIPPSTTLALGGATILLNGSGSNDLIGKHQYREQIVSTQSAKTISAYMYASCGYGESSTDVVFSGQCLIYENGVKLSENQRFTMDGSISYSDIDLERLIHDRCKIGTYADGQLHLKDHTIREVMFDMVLKETPLDRFVNPHPFVPADVATRDIRCEEIFAIQRNALAKRLEHIGQPKAIIGISGGLDSTLALLVTVKAFDLLQRDRKDIIAVTMPGFGTTDRTYNNAIDLMEKLGVTTREIDIKPACLQHFKDIGHDISNHDLTFENVQARERTQILMDLCSVDGGIVIGTGDLSELALGWATYNGDHMSMYAVNVSIPKTLVRYLIQWVAKTSMDVSTAKILMDIFDTPVSPELLPPDSDGEIAQKTEEVVGPYELHDFYLYNMLRFGFTPQKIYQLALHAFKNTYEPAVLLKWLKVFYKRFFSQQFKRSCIPDGPKVGSINLSPRGDWRMPSDACVRIWMDTLDQITV